MRTASKIPERQRTILVVTPYYASHGGAIERVAGQLIANIAATDNFRFIWAASRDNDEQEVKDVALLPMTPLLSLNIFGRKWPIWGPQSLHQLKQAVAAADCVWLHETLSSGARRAFHAARKLGKTIIITQHNCPSAPSDLRGRARTNILDKYVTWNMLRQAQQTTFTSDGAADFYYRRVGFTNPVTIIPNGVDLDAFHPPAASRRKELRRRFALKDDQPVLLFNDDFATAKGIHIVRALAGQLPGWRIWLAGEGPVKPEGWFMPNVQVFRKGDISTMLDLYHAADLLVIPRADAQFPLAAQEAMACGLPIICGSTIATGNQSARPYLWSVEVDLSAPQRTAENWAKKLKAAKQLLPLTEAKTELSDLAQSTWEWPVIAGYYADILRDVCKSGVKPAARRQTA